MHLQFASSTWCSGVARSRTVCMNSTSLRTLVSPAFLVMVAHHGSSSLSLPHGCASAAIAHARVVRSRRVSLPSRCAARPQLLSALRRKGVLRPLLDLLPVRGWADLDAVETRQATYGRCAAAARCASKSLTPSAAASLPCAPCVRASLWASTLG